jgi:hypothetical protein
MENPGIGRRAFLQFFGGIIASAAANPLSAVVVSDDVYVNRKLGLAFAKPAGWAYESIGTFRDLRDEYELATVDPAVDEQFRSGALPIAIVSQAPVKTTIAASFTVFAEHCPLEGDETLMGVLPLVLAQYRRMFRDFKVSHDPSGLQICGYESASYVSSFIYEDSSGKYFPVRHRGVVTVRPPLLYTFNMMDIPEMGICTERQFDEVIGSIRYV